MTKTKDFRLQPLAIIVIGASGDLAKKKTFPSLYQLFLQGELPNHVILYGYARTNLTHEDFRNQISMFLVDGSAEEKRTFLSLCFYRAGMDYQDVMALHAMRSHLNFVLWQVRDTTTNHPKNSSSIPKIQHAPDHLSYLFYMAIPSNIFEVATKAILQSFQDDVAHPSSNDIRILYEKPFGKDLSTYIQLSQSLFRLGLKEEQIYRIDHYLGKPMVRAIPLLRFGPSSGSSKSVPIMVRQLNSRYHPIGQWLERHWNHSYIQYVMIEMCEPFGAEGRGYFNDYGIIRDVFQNHLIQIMTLISMEQPTSWNTSNHDDIRDAKCAVLKHIRHPSITDCVLGQYEGYSYNGKKSHTPTYAAIRIFVDNDRWRDVPFFLIAGKALETRRLDIKIGFHSIGSALDHSKGRIDEIIGPTKTDAHLLFRIQPEQTMTFTCHTEGNRYQQSFEDHYISSSKVNSDYSTLILDSLKGNSSYFVRDDELRLSWEIFTPLLNETNKAPIYQYKCGSTGPKEVQKLLASHVPKESTEISSRL